MRTKLIAGNWKLNPATVEGASDLLRQLKLRLAPYSKTQIAVCPPYTAIHQAVEMLRDTRIGIGGQNLYFEESGAFTGEISASILHSLGCRYVIIGHSERRNKFRETNKDVRRKIQAAIKHDLVPIACIGENLAERNAGVMKEVIKRQIKMGLIDTNPRKLIIAYEPVWAIGTSGIPATPTQAQEMHNFIREMIADYFGEPIADNMRILYGGNVKPENATELLKQPDIDGALVGGACLNADSFAEIVRSAEELM